MLGFDNVTNKTNDKLYIYIYWFLYAEIWCVKNKNDDKVQYKNYSLFQNVEIY